MYRLLQDPDYRRKSDVLLRSSGQLDQMVGGFCTMDADVFFATAEGVIRFNNTESEEFFERLTSFFDECLSKGDRYFKVYSARSTYNEFNFPGRKNFVFVADRTGDYIGLRFELENGHVVFFNESDDILSPFAMKKGSKRLVINAHTS